MENEYPLEDDDRHRQDSEQQEWEYIELQSGSLLIRKLDPIKAILNRISNMSENIEEDTGGED